MRTFSFVLLGVAVVAFGGPRGRFFAPDRVPPELARPLGSDVGTSDQQDKHANDVSEDPSDVSEDPNDGDETADDMDFDPSGAEEDPRAGNDPAGGYDRSRDGEDPSGVGDDPSDELAHRDAGAHRAKAPRGGCPASMVRVHDYCIDRYEAPNRRGAKPLVMQSANDGAEWCNHHNKRLCTEDEWIGACEGEEKRAYPYGPTHEDGVCNDDKPWRSVDEPTLAKWPAPEAHSLAKALYQASPSGWKHKCTSENGVADMTGNVEEWVARTREHANAWPYILVGCYWSGCYGGGKPTCHSTNDAHGPQFRFYETGFRCCRDAARAKEAR